MSSNYSLWLELAVDPQTSPEIVFVGLEKWLELGLIGDAEVQRICRDTLSCSLADAPAPIRTDIPARSPAPPPAVEPSNRQPTSLAQIRQSLATELSLNWLLALGVFVVVVSSGALAASQWQRVSSIGQYSILWAYTLAFLGAGLWAGRQEKLPLTGRMLRSTAVLLVPINFWAIDGLNLWNSGPGWLVAVFAGISLTLLTSRFLRPVLPVSAWVCTLCLSWLHWGWGIAGWPLFATYLGAIATAACLFYSNRNAFRPNADLSEIEPLPLSLSAQAILATCAMLPIARALLVVGIPIQQLGLLLGVLGWQLCWVGRSRAKPVGWLVVGGVLLVAGWRVTVTDLPLQALAISGLATWILAERLQRLWRVAELLLLFGVGLQGMGLLWQLVPAAARQQIVVLATETFGATGMPWALVALGLMPYLWWVLAGTAWLRARQQPRLALQLERMAMVLGAISTLAGAINPGVRSLSLFLTAGTLAIVTRKRSSASLPLIYLTHLFGVAATIAGIDFVFPGIGLSGWAAIGLGMAIAEWSFTSASPNWPLWRQSTWYVGLGLAGLSYIGFLFGVIEPGENWGWLWLATPIAAAVADWRGRDRFQLEPTWIAIGGLFLAQVLTAASPISRLFSLAVATALMAWLAVRKPNSVWSALTVGFGLALVLTGFWQLALVPLNWEWWMVTSAALALLLWLLHPQVAKREGALAGSFAIAANGWAIALVVPNLLLLFTYNLELYWTDSLSASSLPIAAALLTVTATAYRAWHRPANLEFYALAFGLEMVGASALAFAEQPFIPLALFNLGLGLALQVGGDWWVRRTGQSYLLSWHVVPAAYALLGALLPLGEFAAVSGLYTLAFAFVSIGLGRRHISLRPFSYVGLAAIAVAAYQLLVYQLLQVSGGEVGDGVGLLALLAVAIATLYRLFSNWIAAYTRSSDRALAAIADIHWVGCSLLLWVALMLPVSYLGHWIWLVGAMTAALYGAMRGRIEAPIAGGIQLDFWIYGGMLWGVTAIGYGLYWTVPEPTLLLQWAGALAAALCLLLYRLPWGVWGWSPQPWQRAALVLPGLVVGVTALGVGWQSLLSVAAFYASMARLTRRVRLSYGALVLADWGIVQLLEVWGWLDFFWLVLLLGGSALYAIQVEPSLASATRRETRHWLRCLAIALICATALIEAESVTGGGWLGVAIGLAVAIAGVLLRTRALLYVGTLSFAIALLRETWLAIATSAAALWSIGILLGLTLIWVAATFESRRGQTLQGMQAWSEALEEWE
ncbi:hypothetical protein [Synechococcus sp. PCC 7336]|uniref:hypothetical protein n=1 Tax=Synechococcus sp. PCC 7336 TaxID=195250 RepID=UPI00034587C9|nr:hypothetical protein [Synechococcus sp. PCC 7336]